MTILLVRLTMIALALVLAMEAKAKTAAEVFESASNSVVVVLGKDSMNNNESLGSGVVLPGGLVVTNCHVVEKSVFFEVKHQGQTYPAKRKHTDHDRDICSLLVDGFNTAPVSLGNTKSLKVGQRVYAIGAPKGLELTLSEGIISRLREVDGGRYIQTSAPISRGSSGGGLFNEEGRLIGLPTFYLADGQQLNFAVPVEWVMELPKRHAVWIKPEQSSTEWLSQVVALEVKQDWPALIRHALQRTLALPYDAAAWYILGSAYGQGGQNDKGIDATQRALRINPEHAAAWHNLAVFYERAGQDDKAIDAYQQTLRIDSEDADAWYELGNVYGRTGKMSKTIEAFQQSLRINPGQSNAWNKLGVAFRLSGQPVKAIETYQEALRTNPKIAGDFDFWKSYGLAYGQAGQTGKAIEAYKLALGLAPEHADTWRDLGDSYLKTEQFVDAFEAFQRAVHINPHDAKPWLGIGLLWVKANKDDKAIEAYQQALRINPEFAVAWYSLGLLYKAQNRQSEVAGIYRRLKTMDPKLAEKYFSQVVIP